MPKALSREQVDAFARDGFLYGFDAISAGEASGLRRRMEDYERSIGADANTVLRVKAHLGFPWMIELARNPKVLDVIEDIIGPNIRLYLSSLWPKGARDGKFVSWHQDSAYYGLEPHEEITAWVALTPSDRTNGCVRVIPGTHRGGDFTHVETFESSNLLSRGQTIQGLDIATAVDMELRPGQFSVHHEKLVHGSDPNNSDDRRIGIAFMYVPTHVRSTVGRRASILVRGEDRHGYWDDDPVPRFDLDPVAMAAMKRAQDAYRDRGLRSEAERAGAAE